jgi:hypothetical protein
MLEPDGPAFPGPQALGADEHFECFAAGHGAAASGHVVEGGNMVKHLAGLDCSQGVRRWLSFRYLPYSIKQESKPARETLLILGLAVPPWRTRPACAVVVGCFREKLGR